MWCHARPLHFTGPLSRHPQKKNCLRLCNYVSFIAIRAWFRRRKWSLPLQICADQHSSPFVLCDSFQFCPGQKSSTSAVCETSLRFNVQHRPLLMSREVIYPAPVFVGKEKKINKRCAFWLGYQRGKLRPCNASSDKCFFIGICIFFISLTAMLELSLCPQNIQKTEFEEIPPTTI